jgi:hypothetical protein
MYLTARQLCAHLLAPRSDRLACATPSYTHARAHTHPPAACRYEKPVAPVHMMIGMSGAGHLGKPYDTRQAWSAYSEISYGWVKGTFANASALLLQFVANGDGLMSHGTPSVHDHVWITK